MYIASDERLSFSLHPSYGGYHMGSYIVSYQSSPFRKIIYYKRHCDTTIDAVLPMDGNCFMNDVVHHWNIKSNLIDRGWTQCYIAPYSDATVNVSHLGCPTGGDDMVFVGALSTPSSTQAYLGFVYTCLIYFSVNIYYLYYALNPGHTDQQVYYQDILHH